jgi:hypothetical protein
MSYGKRVLTIDRHWRVLDDGIEATLVIETSRRWYRAGLVIGQAPGSHMGFWRTRPGDFPGWNYRIGDINTALRSGSIRPSRDRLDAGQCTGRLTTTCTWRSWSAGTTGEAHSRRSMWRQRGQPHLAQWPVPTRPQSLPPG